MPPIRYIKCLSYLLILCCGALAVFACQTSTIAPADPAIVETVIITPSIAETNPEFWEQWKSGPHAAIYDLGKGPNSYCARCHSPANWDPAAHVDPPPNCVSCKFSFEETPRIAEGNPLISEDQWSGLDCNVCHQIQNGLLNQEFSWFDKVSGYYETVTPTELCEKCHNNTETLNHKILLDENTHPGYSCIDCHDAHTATASCGSYGCHDKITITMQSYNPVHIGIDNNAECLACHEIGIVSQFHTTWDVQGETTDCLGCHAKRTVLPVGNKSISAGHTIYHQNVKCMACHDASNLEVGPVDGQSFWTTFRTTQLLGNSTTVPYSSHDLQRNVDCNRCHFANNPWGLPVQIEAGSPQ